MSESAMPPHPGLEAFTNVEELKHLCPAFSKGCPYATAEEVKALAVSRGEVSLCPAFQNGCPFSAKSEEEIKTLMSQIPKDHPPLNITEIPSCEEGVILVKMLNRFLDKTRIEFNNVLEEKSDVVVTEIAEAKPEPIASPEPEYLEDPQLAAAMREGTKVVHRAAESSVFTKRFLKGEINSSEYGRYINSLYFVYKHMEDLLEKHKEHPVVKIIHFPHELNREESILKDLEYFYGKEKTSELIKIETMTPAVQKYVKAMNDACAKNPGLLIAHSYSRYLGDLSGGQILSKRLKKHVLKLDENDSSWDTTDGLNFYAFNNLGNQSDFKNFYRERLNGAPVDAATRDLIVAEAVLSFELNIALFDEIQELSEAGKLAQSVIQIKEESVVVSEEKVEIITRETKTSVSEKLPKKESKSFKWVSIATVTVAAIAVGATIYQRYYNQKK